MQERADFDARGLWFHRGVRFSLFDSLVDTVEQFALGADRGQFACELAAPKERDERFRYIREQKETFQAEGLPILSVDTRKKELIGNFKNPGSTWERSPRPALDHDFRSHAEAIAVLRNP